MSLLACKICKQSWDPPRNIIYKNGMCIVCYHRTVDWMNEKDADQKSIEEFIEV